MTSFRAAAFGGATFYLLYLHNRTSSHVFFDEINEIKHILSGASTGSVKNNISITPAKSTLDEIAQFKKCCEFHVFQEKGFFLLLVKKVNEVRLGAAHEEQFIHDHDRELIKKLQVELAKKKTEHAAAEAALKAVETAPKVNDVSPVDVGYGSGNVGKSTGLGSKEGAAEELYFRNLDKERLEKLKK